jgi:hypothetical protein
MSRRTPIGGLFVVLALASIWPAAAMGHHPTGDESTVAGMAGLRPATEDGPCAGEGYEMVHAGAFLGCTHGPDPAPPGVDIADPPSIAEIDATTTGDGVVPCFGDGVSGNRVQAVYAYQAGTTSNFAAYTPTIQAIADSMNATVHGSAAETGGVRELRYVHDTSCRATVVEAAVSSAAMATFSTMVAELRSSGLSRGDRKYLVWADGNTYCGIAQRRMDESPSQGNANNVTTLSAMYGRVDRSCWSGVAPLHELFHTLGAVQDNAPNTSGGGHCVDEWDVMCYVDAPGVVMRFPCPTRQTSQVLDCNHDDYFSTAPPAGSYLATHWNTANSSWLASGAQTLPSAPGQLRMVGASESTISIAWAASDGADRYEVFLNGFAAQVAAGTSATLTGLACGTSYALGVEAIGGSGGRSPQTALIASTATCPLVIVDRPPTVRALAARGTRGALARLAYRVADEGDTRATITIYRSGRIVAVRRTAFGAAPSRAVSWRAPRRLLTGFRFCVQVWDRAGNASGVSCATIRLR